MGVRQPGRAEMEIKRSAARMENGREFVKRPAVARHAP
jgi:hypothetical protein